jgi:hypothetical protein
MAAGSAAPTMTEAPPGERRAPRPPSAPQAQTPVAPPAAAATVPVRPALSQIRAREPVADFEVGLRLVALVLAALAAVAAAAASHWAEHSWLGLAFRAGVAATLTATATLVLGRMLFTAPVGEPRASSTAGGRGWG